MALTATSLATAMAVDSLVAQLTSATGFAVGQHVRIDSEWMVITAIDGVNISVRRGLDGSAQVAHKILAQVVTTATPADWSILSAAALLQRDPTHHPDIVAIGANGAIPVPKRETIFFINKGAALATSTFADPGKDQDGLEVTFIGTTDFAHVVTTVTAHDGTTGLHTTLTSPAFIGGSLTLIAYGGKWLTKANALWVIS